MANMLFAFMFSLVFLVACKGGDDQTDNAGDLAQLSGRITAVDGTVLPGVTVNVVSDSNSQSVVSDAAGMINLELNADSTAILQLKADAYADQVVPVKAPSANGSVFLDITMIARGAIQTFDSAAGGSFNGADGASVTVGANSFVDADGVAVTGSIELTITPVDVSRPASLAALPGEFSGIPEGAATDSPIISLGTVEFEFSQNGSPVNLAPGMTAEILIPIYTNTYQDGTAVNIGDSIALWSLNEDTGIWLQEGTGTVVASASSPTGLAIQATVSHFSWWYIGYMVPYAYFTVTVTGPEAGTALIKAMNSDLRGWVLETYERVTAIGVPTEQLFFPASHDEICFWAEVTYVSGATGSTAETCITPVEGAIYPIDLIAPGPGPVQIETSPAAVANVLNKTAYIRYADRVQLRPATYETWVNYNIVSGALPPGLSLNTVSATHAEIAGIPIIAGSFSAVVQATDSSGNTATVTINYTVETDVIPPVLPGIIGINYTTLPAIYDLNELNTGGPATSWSIPGLPIGATLNTTTGILTITDSCLFFSNGTVTASNSGGNAMTDFYLQDFSCQ